MCGADLVLTEGQSFTGCESCGTRQMGPQVDSDGTYYINEEVKGYNGKTNYVPRERNGGTYHEVSSWDLW